MQQYILGLLLVIIIYIIIAPFTSKEHFIQYENPYKEQVISYIPKKNVYMDFLGNLYNSYHTYLNTYKTTSYDDRIKIHVENKALQDAFDTKKYDITDKKSINKDCLYKSTHLCELTNPMLYLSESKYFPPRWIFKPYSNVPLPKHIDLTCWNNMFNCCNKNF